MLTRRCPGGRDRGSVAVFTVVFAVAVVALLALIVDGGIALSARQRAADIAGQAARAAADTIDTAVLRSRGVAQIGPGACQAAAGLVAAYGLGRGDGVDRVARAAMVGCSAPVGSETATVRVTVTTRPLLPGILAGFRETAAGAATVECGIAQEGTCR